MKKLFIAAIAFLTSVQAVLACLIPIEYGATAINFCIYSLNHSVMHYVSHQLYPEDFDPTRDRPENIQVTYRNRQVCDLPITVQWMPSIAPVKEFYYSVFDFSVPAITSISLMYRVFDSSGIAKGPIHHGTYASIPSQYSDPRWGTPNWVENLLGSAGVIDIPDSEISPGDYIVIGVSVNGYYRAGGAHVDTFVSFAPYMDYVDNATVIDKIDNIGVSGIFGLSCSVVWSGKRRPMVR